MFRRESGLSAARRGYAVSLSEPVAAPDGTALDWTITASGPEGEAEVAYTILRWDDVVRRHFPRADWRRLAAVPALWWRLWRSGNFAALWRAGPHFAGVILGVHLIFAVLVLLAAAQAVTLLVLLEVGGLHRGLTLALAAGATLAFLALATALTRGRPLYVTHLVDDTAFTHRHAAGGVPEMDARLRTFAARIAAAAERAEEVVVVGHSSGSFLGTQALALALDQAPAPGEQAARGGARIVLLTLGSVTPWITLDAAADRQRTALARVADAPVAWIDVFATWDWLSVHARDPVAASGLAPRAGRPITLQVALSNLADARRRVGTRYNLFQRHFQVLMAGQNPLSFDYPALVASPRPVEAFVESCRAAEDAVLTGGRPATDQASPPPTLPQRPLPGRGAKL